MATTITTDVMEQLITNTKHQRTPETYTSDDYKALAILGCKRFYRDTGIEDSWDDEYTAGDTPTLSRDLDILELDYCLKASEIEFFKQIRNYWNTLVGYTTNALSITMANKPFEQLNATIKEKEVELTDLFHKMTDVSNPSSPSTDISVEAIEYDFD